MDIIPPEYFYYCSGALILIVLTSIIKNYYNITDMEGEKTCIMKRNKSMSNVQQLVDISCFDRIPENKKHVKEWVNSLLKKKHTYECSSPICLNKINSGKMIYMAYDSKFCSDRCRAQAQYYLEKYWNILSMLNTHS